MNKTCSALDIFSIIVKSKCQSLPIIVSLQLTHFFLKSSFKLQVSVKYLTVHLHPYKIDNKLCTVTFIFYNKEFPRHTYVFYMQFFTGKSGPIAEESEIHSKIIKLTWICEPTNDVKNK